jgi:hypothetical protein
MLDTSVTMDTVGLCFVVLCKTADVSEDRQAACFLLVPSLGLLINAQDGGKSLLERLLDFTRLHGVMS